MIMLDKVEECTMTDRGACAPFRSECGRVSAELGVRADRVSGNAVVWV